MITGIPQYQSPIEQSLRCVCGVRYLVYLGGGMRNAEGRAQARASVIRAIYVDARQVPFMNCSCGQFLDFTTESEVVMVH
jgi:hypothetical protein